ncbi:transcriptional regulator [Klebsiella pneumoniae]|nr:transcriptional regulator [Klebsiella pneumoniae]
MAEHCYSNPSSLVRLAKKLKFSGWLELVYFIKFNITMPKLDVTNDIDYMSIQPVERITPLLESLQHHRILIHGSGFSQLIAQYIYNKGKEINLVCFTGDYQSPLAQAADTAFIIHDPQKFDDDIYWSNPFFGYCILGFERLLKMWFMQTGIPGGGA